MIRQPEGSVVTSAARNGTDRWLPGHRQLYSLATLFGEECESHSYKDFLGPDTTDQYLCSELKSLINRR